MTTNVIMPALEMAQETGKLISWLKKEGETVPKGEPLLEIETDKVVMEVPAPSAGVLAEIVVADGGTVVETSVYDRKNDNTVFHLYVIHEDQNLGAELERIVTLELLQSPN